MRAAVLHGPDDLRVQEVEEPEGEVIVEVRAASACGTDRKMLRHGHRILGDYPARFGHETAGVRLDTGIGPEELWDLGEGRALVVGTQRARGSGSGAETTKDFAVLWTFSRGLVTREQYFFDRVDAFRAVSLDPLPNP